MALLRGMRLMLHTCLETKELSLARGIAYHIEETNRAVELFNRLACQGRGRHFHLTC